jgi:hypothetical protein
LYPNTFPSTVSYLWDDFNNRKSTVTFTRPLLAHYNPVIVFSVDSIQLFNIGQDYTRLISFAANHTTPIPFDVNYIHLNFGIEFSVSSCYFSDAKYNNVCENNESYHKLAKQYPLLYDSFDIWLMNNDLR